MMPFYKSILSQCYYPDSSLHKEVRQALLSTFVLVLQIYQNARNLSLGLLLEILLRVPFHELSHHSFYHLFYFSFLKYQSCQLVYPFYSNPSPLAMIIVLVPYATIVIIATIVNIVTPFSQCLFCRNSINIILTPLKPWSAISISIDSRSIAYRIL